MSDATDWKLLARYLSKQCSREEKEKVENGVNSDPENQRLMFKLYRTRRWCTDCYSSFAFKKKPDRKSDRLSIF